MKILRFRHGGIACALPHARVRRVTTTPEGPPSALWPPLADDRASRWIEVDAQTGGAWISCSDPQVDDLGNPQALPALVAGLIGLGHVVGWAPIGDEVVWLVDPARLVVG